MMKKIDKSLPYQDPVFFEIRPDSDDHTAKEVVNMGAIYNLNIGKCVIYEVDTINKILNELDRLEEICT